MVWGALSFNNDNTDTFFGLTCPLNEWIKWFNKWMDKKWMNKIIDEIMSEVEDIKWRIFNE